MTMISILFHLDLVLMIAFSLKNSSVENKGTGSKSGILEVEGSIILLGFCKEKNK